MTSFPQRLINRIPVIACLAALAALLLLARHNDRALPANSLREAQRSALLTQVQAAGQNGITFYDWQNKQEEIVRLPIQRAIELTVSEWKDPSAARSNLLERASVLLAVPPPLMIETNPPAPAP